MTSAIHLLQAGNIYELLKLILTRKAEYEIENNESGGLERKLWESGFGLSALTEPFSKLLELHAKDINTLAEWTDWQSILSHLDSADEDGGLALIGHDVREALEAVILIGLYLPLKEAKDTIDASVYIAHFKTDQLQSLWESCTASKNLRLMPRKDCGLAVMNLLLEINTELESIRIKSLQKAGYNSIKALENPRLLEQLSPVLSVSFVSIREFASISRQILMMNLDFLAIFSSVLPLSWFSPELLGILVNVLMEFQRNSEHNRANIEGTLELLFSHSLLEESSAKPYSGTIPELSAICLLPFVSTKSKELIISTILNYSSKDLGLVPQVSELFRSISVLKISKPLSQSIAQFLAKIPVDDMVQVAQSLLSSSIWKDGSHSLFSIMRIFYHVSDRHCQAFKTAKGSCFSSPIFSPERPVPYFAPRLFSVICPGDSMDPDTEARMFAFYGMIRAFQIRQSKGLPSSKRVLIEWERVFLNGLNVVKSPYLAYLMSEYCSLRSDGPLNAKNMEEYHLVPAIESCFESIFDSEAYLALPQLALLRGMDAEKESVILKCLDSKTGVGSEDLFSALGKISKTVGNGLAAMLELSVFDKVKRLLKRLEAYSVHLADCCDCELLIQPAKEGDTTSLQSRLFKFLKVVFFTVMVLLEPIVAFLQTHLLKEAPKPSKIHAFMISMIESSLSVYLNLHFIASLFGLRVFGMFEKQITVFAASLIKISIINPKYSKLQLRGLDQLYNKNLYENSSSYMELSKTNFFLFVASRMVDFMGNVHLESKVLPIVIRNLLHLDDSTTSAFTSLKADLRDLSHFIWQKIFDSSTLHQSTIRIYGKEYGRTLLRKVHNGIELKLAQDMFTTIIRGLCDFSPAKEHPLIVSPPSSFESLPFFSQNGEAVNTEPDSLLLPVITMDDTEEWAIEALEIAWNLVLDLVNQIQAPSMSSFVPSTNTPSSIKDVIGNSALSREIIRTSLATILFAQIPVIGLSKLTELLDLVETLMLGDSTNSSEDSSEGESTPSKPVTLGIVRNIEMSLVWKSLFAAVSDPNLIDYSRRCQCVVWYTRIYDKAKRKGIYLNGKTTVKASDLILPKAKL